MRINKRFYLAITGTFLFLGVGIAARAGEAMKVRWDIIHLAFTTPPTLSAGGMASATARNPTSLMITLTGSGTFVAPAARGGMSSAVTGGGTWVTYDGCPDACTITGSGTYRVTSLASWQFDVLQLLVNTDLIGPNAANGNAVLAIEYSDGSNGILGVGCHGPGADPGIVEGIIASKGFVTYWDGGDTVPGVDANRTAFHILR